MIMFKFWQFVVRLEGEGDRFLKEIGGWQLQGILFVGYYYYITGVNRNKQIY